MRNITTPFKAVTQMRLATLAMLVGVFTISWDRFGNLQAGGYNVKLPVIAFALSLLLNFVEACRARTVIAKIPRVVVAAVGLFVVFVIMTVFAVSMIDGLLQAITIALGALIPLCAVLLAHKLDGNVLRTLNVFIYGAIVASLYGLYQLAGFYFKLPMLVSYDATDVNGLGRISSFSYESGYFGYFLVLAMTALIAVGVATHRPTNQWLLALFGLTLVLANSRATFVTIPILVVIFMFGWPRGVTKPRVGFIAWGAALGAAGVLLLKPDLVQAIMVRFVSLFDPNEASSNAPRLGVLSASWDIFLDHPIFGIGPASLKTYFLKAGLPIDFAASPNTVVANNIWFQAMLDGGLVLLLCELAFIAIVLVTYFKRAYTVTWILLSGWLTVLLVSGFITSYFWDIKLWAFLGIAISAAYLMPKSAQYPLRHATIG